jgi:DNA-binding transcriptional ArsR family regulator
MAESEELQLLQALKNPVQARILAVLNDRNAGAKEIAQQIGEPIGRVRYHLRALRRAGLIGTARTERRRGVHEKYLSLITRGYVDDERYRSLDPQDRQRLIRFCLRLIMEDMERLMKAGVESAEHPFRIIRMRLALDDQGWQELTDILVDALARIETLKDRTKARLEERKEEAFPVNVWLAGFELPTDSEGDIPSRPTLDDEDDLFEPQGP